jgi:hypothetical protein
MLSLMHVDVEFNANISGRIICEFDGDGFESCDF